MIYASAILAIFILIVVLVWWLNEKFFHLGLNIPLALTGLVLGLIIRAVCENLFADSQTWINIKEFHFNSLGLNALACILAFIGGRKANFKKMQGNYPLIILIASAGTLITAFAFGGLLYLFLHIIMGSQISFVEVMTIAAILAPVESVVSNPVIAKSKLSKNLQSILTGIGYFNMVFGVALFLVFRSILVTGNATVGAYALIFVKQV